MNENTPQQPLSGQQLQAMSKQYADALVAVRKDIELRKWAVDQACGLAGSESRADVPIMNVLELARSIHAFLVEGAAEKAE